MLWNCMGFLAEINRQVFIHISWLAGRIFRLHYRAAWRCDLFLPSVAVYQERERELSPHPPPPPIYRAWPIFICMLSISGITQTFSFPQLWIPGLCILILIKLLLNHKQYKKNGHFCLYRTGCNIVNKKYHRFKWSWKYINIHLTK